jgi:hypothetical protein
MGKTKSKQPKSRQSISGLKKKAWKLFSEWIRRRDANFRGYVRCYTCKKVYHWKRIQAGHYVSRQHNSLFFSTKNVKPQCFSCNIWRYGNSDEFALALKKEYGEHILEELNKEKKKTKQFTVKELEDIINATKWKIQGL